MSVCRYMYACEGACANVFCVYTGIYVGVEVHMHVCVYLCVCRYMYVCEGEHACMFVCMQVCVKVHMHALCVCVHAGTGMCMKVHMLHMHVSTCHSPGVVHLLS